VRTDLSLPFIDWAKSPGPRSEKSHRGQPRVTPHGEHASPESQGEPHGEHATGQPRVTTELSLLRGLSLKPRGRLQMMHGSVLFASSQGVRLSASSISCCAEAVPVLLAPPPSGRTCLFLIILARRSWAKEGSEAGS
jgi:hypothetical protein